MFELAGKSTRHQRMRTKDQLQRIARVGGMIAAMTQPPEMRIDERHPPRSARPRRIARRTARLSAAARARRRPGRRCMNTRWKTMTIHGVKPAIAFGTDFNGISYHNRPRFGDDGAPAQTTGRRVRYPFTLNGFGTFASRRPAQREFDFNTQGLAISACCPTWSKTSRRSGSPTTSTRCSARLRPTSACGRSRRSHRSAGNPGRGQRRAGHDRHPDAAEECQQLEQHGRDRVAAGY